MSKENITFSGKGGGDIKIDCISYYCNKSLLKKSREKDRNKFPSRDYQGGKKILNVK